MAARIEKRIVCNGSEQEERKTICVVTRELQLRGDSQVLNQLHRMQVLVLAELKLASVSHPDYWIVGLYWWWC
jgi:hypothetical protein